MAHTARPLAPKHLRVTDSNTTVAAEAVGGVNEDPHAVVNVLSPSAQVPQYARAREPPQLERAVVSRTRFTITLLASPSPTGGNKGASVSEADQRGWSSPHGEPYRPLGRPELHLKFSPHLVNGVSPTIQNAHRIRTLEGGEDSDGALVGTGSSFSSEKTTEAREASSCAGSSNGASIATLVDQFVASLATHKRPPDDRQVKLAHRLQANVGGFSPESISGLHRHKAFSRGQHQELAIGDKQLCYHKSRGDKSLQLLREAIEKGTGRLRSTRNGINFLQHVDPPEFHWLHKLHDEYLHARTKSPQSLTHRESNSGEGLITSPRPPKTVNRDATVRVALKRDEDSKSDEGQDIWYMPYTTRQLQRPPHRHLPSLSEFRVQSRDEKQPTRPLRASSNIKASVLQHRLRANAPRSNHTSLSSARSSMPLSLGVLNTTGGNGDILEHKLAVLSTAIGKGAASPFAMPINSPLTAPSVPHLHNIEKLQAAVDALESTKCKQSARLTTALEILEQDRRDCLAGKFCSLRVCCNASEDLKRMRERSERHRAQRALELVSKTADWYPEVLRHLVAREGATASSTGAGSMSTRGLLPLHAAEHFIVQAVHRFTNIGCEFQPAQLYTCILHLHPEDLELLQVQQLLGFIRNALHINDDEWTHFVDDHGLPERIADFGGDRKDHHGGIDGKLGVPTASTARVGVSAPVTSLEGQGSQLIQ